MTEPVTLSPGTLVAGKLRILRLLGQGGMGAVYEVEHEFTKHRRALKLLHADMARHENVVARFLREASAAGRIGNQHIVESFDAGTLDTGEPYLVMELLDGETLEARLLRVGTLPVEEIADFFSQACDGVQAAHDAGIVHRDLKPENLFITQRRDGWLLKILDFGISRFDPTLTGANAVTREGSTLGTPYYMSPEQIEGDKDLDARADIYALGVILYQCASGQRPYEAPALPKLSVLIHLGQPTRLDALRPELPGDFVEIVHRAMAKDRDDRFPTARELGEALAHFGSSALGATLEGPALASDPSRSTRRPVGVRISDRSIPPQTPIDPSLKPVAPSMMGAAVSVAHERRPARRGIAIAAAVVVPVLAAVYYVARWPRDAVVVAPPATLAASAPPALPPAATPTGVPVQASPPPASATPASPAASASAATLPPVASVRQPTSAPKASASVAPAPARPTGSSRADQSGLSPENPF